jgi:hypothetical protein
MSEFQWNAETISKISAQHYEALSTSDKLVLQQICMRALPCAVPKPRRKSIEIK